MFQGYFHGISDASLTSTETQQVRLHSVEATKESFMMNMQLNQIDFSSFNVVLQHIRRPNMLEDIMPRPDIVINAGDTLVLLGSQANLRIAEKFLLTGR